MNKAIIMRFGFILIIVGLLLAIYFAVNPSQPSKPVACTMEARECPGGSFVSRTGPNCEFAECPSVLSTTSTNVATTSPVVAKPRNLSFKNAQFGFSFQYPSGSVISKPTLPSSAKDAIQVKLPAHGADAGMAVEFMVMEKDSFIQYSEKNECQTFVRSTISAGGKTFDAIEHDTCANQKGIQSPTHYVTAVIPLSETLDLVYNANIGSRGPEAVAEARTIVSSLSF